MRRKASGACMPQERSYEKKSFLVIVKFYAAGRLSESGDMLASWREWGGLCDGGGGEAPAGSTDL